MDASKIAEVDSKYADKSAKVALDAFFLQVAKKQTAVWSNRASSYQALADKKESERTNLFTTPEDVLERNPWMRKEIQEELDAGDWGAEYDIKVPENPDDFPEEIQLRINPKFKEHKAEDAELEALHDKVSQIEKANQEEQLDSWRIRNAFNKAPIYGFYKSFTQ